MDNLQYEVTVMFSPPKRCVRDSGRCCQRLLLLGLMSGMPHSRQGRPSFNISVISVSCISAHDQDWAACTACVGAWTCYEQAKAAN